MTDFRLLMISAMYENGGNYTHRLLDGHPQLYVYPFESQLGTRFVNDNLSSLFPLKYRWPSFQLHSTAEQDYAAIIDEEGKVRARTPHVSKFRHIPFDLSDDERAATYCSEIAKSGRSRPANVAAFFRATFDTWKDYARTGKEVTHVGYSPIIVVDAEKILEDFPQAHVLHVVRNPWSAYADTKRRPVPLSLDAYMLGWTLCQYHALLYAKKYPDRFHLVRVEDTMAAPAATLTRTLATMGLEGSGTLAAPSWNGTPLNEVFPWGTIRTGTPEANHATAMELSKDEQARIRERTWQYLDVLDYSSYLDG